MAIEMGGGEEGRRVILDQRLLVRLGRDPEHDDVAIALAGPRVDRIRARIAEEDERLPAHLVDRVVSSAVVHGDMWHAQSQLVHVLDPRWLARVVRHAAQRRLLATGSRLTGRCQFSTSLSRRRRRYARAAYRSLQMVQQ